MSGDAELDALAVVKNALESLDLDAQERVLAWAVKRFDITLPGAGKASGSKRTKVEEHDGADAQGDSDEEAGGSAGMQFDHFAEMFAQAQPRSDADRALVAAYWVQEVEGKAEWGAQPVNAALKNLGHSLSHISEAMSTNMKKKPQLIIQLKKAGNTRQARKTYRVTEAGKTAVRGMLGDGAPHEPRT